MSDSIKRQALIDLFGVLHEISPNLNDTFAYACADIEALPVGDGEQLADFYLEHGWEGLVAVAAMKRGLLPIAPVAESEAYQRAWKALVDNPQLQEDLELD